MTASPPVRISSPANPTIRRLVRLRDHRRRRQAQRVLVDGWRETLRAVEAGLVPRGLFVSEETAPAADARDELMGRLQSSDDPPVPQFVLPPALFKRIAYGNSPRGVVAEFEQPDRSLEKLGLPDCPLVLVLDEVEKPGNVGAVFRTADAAGVDAVILCDPGCDLFNPNAIRSSLGTVFTLPAAVGSYHKTEAFLAAAGLRVLAARVESSTPLWQTDLGGPLAVVLGSESLGLRGRWRTVAGQPVAGIRIPMHGHADSLNVSVSAAVIAYEAIRCRRGEFSR